VSKYLKVFAGVLFSLLFIIFLLISTLRFEILNSSFVFSSFERGQVYQRLPKALAESLPNDPNLPEDEREDYSEIVSSIKPEGVKKVVEENLAQFIDFLNGKQKDINVSISSKDVAVLGGSDVKWSLSQHPEIQNSQGANMAYGVGNKLLLVWVLLLLILLGLIKLVGMRLLLVGGVVSILLGLFLKLFLIVINSAPMGKAEPSQALLGLMVISILPDTSISWVTLGLILVISWIVLTKVARARK
jgi:hypothetical protein